jgi:hypothetical protein
MGLHHVIAEWHWIIRALIHSRVAGLLAVSPAYGALRDSRLEQQ